VRTVDHISFTVGDLDRSIAFYRLLLGRDPVEVGEERAEHAARVAGYPGFAARVAWFSLPGTSTLLELFEYLEPRSTAVPLENYHVGNAHLAFVVADIEAEYERLLAAGAVFAHPGPVEATEPPWRGTRAVYMRDPDGITIELMQSPPPPGAPRARTYVEASA
jgi:catechol 2,3-dioxygenase-like lactoylglutathione lyase family enzyme